MAMRIKYQAEPKRISAPANKGKGVPALDKRKTPLTVGGYSDIDSDFSNHAAGGDSLRTANPQK